MTTSNTPSEIVSGCIMNLSNHKALRSHYITRTTNSCRILSSRIILSIVLIVGLCQTNGIGQTVIQIGTGTSSPSVATNPGTNQNAASPYGINVQLGNMGKKLQMIYTPSMINAAMSSAGYTPGASLISKVGWNISPAVGLSNLTYNNYTIKMANVSQADIPNNTSGYYAGALSTVFGPSSMPIGTSSAGWFSLNLSTPFQWDGISNLCVEVCYTITGVGLTATYGGCQFTDIPGANHMIYKGGASINCSTSLNGGTLTSRLCNMRLSVSPANVCTGLPNVATAGSANVCAGTSATIGLSGLTAATGYSYLWKSSSNIGGPYSNASGINNNSTYSTPTTLPSNPTYYICEVTCNASGLMSASSAGVVSLNSPINCSCPVSYAAANGSTRGITKVVIASPASPIINNSSVVNNVSPYYTLYTAPSPVSNAGLTLNTGYTVSVKVGSQTAASNNVGAWIDYNQNGIFETTEFLGGFTNAAANSTTNINYTVPATATTGVTALRIRHRYAAAVTNADACTFFNGTSSSGGAGETEDYRVNISGDICSGNPSVISFSPTSPMIGLGNSISISASAASTNGVVTYSWSPSTGLSSTSGATVIASPTATTTYTVTAFDGFCTKTGTVTVTVTSGTSGLVSCGYTYSSGIAWTSIQTTGTALGNPGNNNYLIDLSGGTPFNFDFNGITYNKFGINGNGYMYFGTAQSPTITTPISSNAAYDGVISAWGEALTGSANSIVYQVQGVSPNRTLTVQWGTTITASGSTVKVAGTNNGVGFQIILYENNAGSANSNKIQLSYSNQYPELTNNNSHAQVGLRGATNIDFINRTQNSGLVTSTSTTAGSTNASTINMNATSYINANILFTYTPTIQTPTITSNQLNICVGGSGAMLTANSTLPLIPSTYSWSQAGTNVGTASTYLSNPSTAGVYNYTVTVTNSTGCYRTSNTASVVVNSCIEVVNPDLVEDEILSPTTLTKNTIIIYPNPNNGNSVNLSMAGINSDNVFIRIFDSKGGMMYTNRYSIENTLNTSISFVQSLAAGLYTVEMIVDGEVVTEKLMVTK